MNDGNLLKIIKEWVCVCAVTAVSALLLCLALMNQAVFAQETVLFTGTDWNEFSYTKNGMTFRGAQYVCDDADIDNDDDGLIEVCHLESLNAVRYVLDGSGYKNSADASTSTQGCASSGCTGYELVRDLDFKLDTSYRSTANNQGTWTSGDGWQPIGKFSGIFEGNGHTVSHLRIVRSSDDYVGLFSRLSNGGIINGIGLLGVGVRGDANVGGLVGSSEGTISNSYSRGSVRGDSTVGSLVGMNNRGMIRNSYSSGHVTGREFAGGLVGMNDHGMIRSNYSIGRVTSYGFASAGGLVGYNLLGTISNSYSIGQVTGEGFIGGLIGLNIRGTIIDSYWDITASNLTISDGGTSQTTVELQSPIDAGGIYSSWRDTDWDFGTAYHYPAIKYSTGTKVGYEACGRSQQRSCGALLGGAEWQIKRVAIATQTAPQVDALEGEIVVLDASQGNFDYSWARIGDTSPSLKLNATDTAELWFVVPSDLVSKTATTKTLTFELTVSLGKSTTQQTVQVIITKVNNDRSTIVLGSISRDGNVLTAPPIASSPPDADSASSTSTILYQWQRCLVDNIRGRCWNESPRWTDTGVSTRVYSVEGTEEPYRFRVVVSHTDGQGYTHKVISESTTTTTVISRPLATTFTGTHWSQFAGGAKAVCDDADIDNDNDGLIELCYLEDLNAIRYSLAGLAFQFDHNASTSTQGCGPGGCRGYELVRDLDFEVEDSYFNVTQNRETRTGDKGWQPIAAFEGILEGNGHTISNLVINRPSQQLIGLFSSIASTGIVNGLCLLDIEVYGREFVGGLVGLNSGTISNSYSIGQVTGSSPVGGLVGYNNRGIISNSYSIGSVSGDNDVGGLVGQNNKTISNSYSSGQVIADSTAGGLVGLNSIVANQGTIISRGTISNSYSVGQVTGRVQVGGLVGSVYTTGTIASYWDITTSNLAISGDGTGKTTTELQTPTDTTDIYRSWSDTDWNFGTAYQYPAIKYSKGAEDYEACGHSQQRFCGALLGGAEWQIKRVAIATQTAVQVDALEGEVIVLDASQGNFDYSWARIGNTNLSLKLNTTDTAELWFVVPSDLVVGEAATRSLEFLLMVSASGKTTQQTVQVTVTKVNNGRGTIALEIGRDGNDLAVPPIDLLPDADGAGSISSISYRWQRCLSRIRASCLDESPRWTNTDVTTRVYLVEEAEAMQPYRFRAVVSYTDGQAYTEEVISESIAITTITRSLATTFTGTHWGQFVGGAKAVCDDADIDNDNDGLIELCYLEDLSAIRYALDGLAFQFYSDAQTRSTFGCGSGGCRGYELVRDLDFEVGDSYFDAAKNQAPWTSGDGWQPIGKFSGILEGNGYTVSNLTIDRPRDNVGLFSHLASGSTVIGISLLDVEVRGQHYVGSLVGQNNEGTISNSYSSGSVSGENETGGLVGRNSRGGSISNSTSTVQVSTSGDWAGGLVGVNHGTISDSYSSGPVNGNWQIGGLAGYNSGTISDSHSSGSVSGNGNRVGGLVGANSGGIISDSYSSGPVTSRNGSNVGGLAGQNSGGTITNSYSSGPVSGNLRVGGLVGLNDKDIINCYNLGEVNGDSVVGGLVGHNDELALGGVVINQGTIINSYNSGPVTGTGTDAGGLVGLNRGIVANSHSSGSVDGKNNVGGLVGWSNRDIINSYSSGPVTGTGTDAGGLVGQNEGTIASSYSSGSVDGKNNVGGLVGWSNQAISNSYSSGPVSGTDNVGGLVGISKGSITYSYSRGPVSSAGSSVGGLVAVNEGAVNDSYWDRTTSRLLMSAGGTGKTTVELQTPTTATDIYSEWSERNWDFGTVNNYPAIRYTRSIYSNNPTCGTLGQPLCGSLLAGQRIRRIAISSQASVRAEAVESETVVLNATTGNFTYQWNQTDGPRVPYLSTTDNAVLQFLVPTDLVNKEATTGILEFQLTVRDGTTTIRRQTVQIVVDKIDNGPMTQPTVTRITAGSIKASAALATDLDGVGTIEAYQWQKCLANADCSRGGRWDNIPGAINDSYQIPKAEAENNQFRVRVTYRDGQNYQRTLTSPPLTYVKLRIIDIDPISTTEGAVVVIIARASVNLSGLSYVWHATTGDKTPSILKDSTLTNATLVFTVPTDWADTAQTTLSLSISVGDGVTTSTKPVIVNITRIDNGGLTTKPKIIERDRRLTVRANLSTDPDGGGTAEAYQWQICSGSSCSWQSAPGTSTASSYTIREEDAGKSNQFRVQLTYRDGQGYSRTVISEVLNYGEAKAVFMRLKLFLEGALQ